VFLSCYEQHVGRKQYNIRVVRCVYCVEKQGYFDVFLGKGR
jgi:hypothetical protein